MALGNVSLCVVGWGGIDGRRYERGPESSAAVNLSPCAVEVVRSSCLSWIDDRKADSDQAVVMKAQKHERKIHERISATCGILSKHGFTTVEQLDAFAALHW